MYTDTTENEKKKAKIAQIVVIIHIIAFLLGALGCSAQIGCSKQEIMCADTLFTEMIEYRDCIYTKSDSVMITVFNFKNDECINFTVFVDKRKGDDYVRLLQSFVEYNYRSYSSSITYYGNDLMIFKVQKE